jgi:hypothetical protein
LSPEASVLATDPSFVNCCRYVNAHYSFANEPRSYAELVVCCDRGVLPDDEFNGPFCTPWGPPVPPALGAELEAAA